MQILASELPVASLDDSGETTQFRNNYLPVMQVKCDNSVSLVDGRIPL